MKSRKSIFSHLVVGVFVALVLVGTFLFGQSQASATETKVGGVALPTDVRVELVETEEKKGESFPIKPLAAALALGLGAIGTAMAQMKIGAAGAGAMAEKPELATMFIVMIALPETIVILGFVVAAMIIMF